MNLPEPNEVASMVKRRSRRAISGSHGGRAFGGALLALFGLGFMALPPSALADTPSIPPEVPHEPETPLDVLVDLGGAALTIGIVVGSVVLILAALSLLGHIVASFGRGGSSGDATGSERAAGGKQAAAGGQAATPRAAGRQIRPAVLAVAVIAGVGGALAGRYIAYESSLGGLRGSLAGLFGMVAIGGVVIALAVIAVVALRVRAGAANDVIRAMLMASGLLALGSIAGAASAEATGGVYRPPVVLQAIGRTQASIQAGDVSFAAREQGEAECLSGADTEWVADVVALDLGELGRGTLRAWIGIRPPATDADIELIIDGADVAPEAGMPAWRGAGRAELVVDGGIVGSVSFSDLPVELDLPHADAEQATFNWPERLSGTIQWACDPWVPRGGDGDSR